MAIGGRPLNRCQMTTARASHASAPRPHHPLVLPPSDGWRLGVNFKHWRSPSNSLVGRSSYEFRVQISNAAYLVVPTARSNLSIPFPSTDGLLRSCTEAPTDLTWPVLPLCGLAR